MNPNRFDQLSRMFARRGSRRGLVAGSLGLTGAMLGGRTLAQEATPAATPALDSDDPHPSADEATVDPMFLFVQPFESGTWTSKDGEDGVYTLILSGADANTVYFSDRPARIVGLAPTQTFLDGLGFTPDNPPNAALVAQRPDGGEQEVLVIELYAPAYDPVAGTLTYDARVLADYGEPGLAHLAPQQTDYELGESFDAGSLFIDGCSDHKFGCYLPSGLVGTVKVPRTYDYLSMECKNKKSPAKVCAESYDACTNRDGDHVCTTKRIK